MDVHYVYYVVKQLAAPLGNNGHEQSYEVKKKMVEYVPYVRYVGERLAATL